MRKKTVKNQGGWALGYTVIVMLVCTLLMFAMIGIQLTDYKLTQKERERLEQKQAFDTAGQEFVNLCKSSDELSELQTVSIQSDFEEEIELNETEKWIKLTLTNNNKTLIMVLSFDLDINDEVSNFQIEQWQYS